MGDNLYRLKPTRLEQLTEGPTEEERQVLGRHFPHLRDGCRDGVVVLAGRTTGDDGRTFGTGVGLEG